MQVLQIETCSFRNPMLMHETRHIGRHHTLRAMPQVIVNLVQPHTRGNGLVGHAERTTKPAAIIRAVNWNQHESFYLFQKRFGLVEIRSHNLGRFGLLRDRESNCNCCE